MSVEEYVIDFKNLRLKDINKVGGKNASLGEMIHHLSEVGVKVPGGFATTAQAFLEFLKQASLQDRINERLAQLDVENVGQLKEVGDTIRGWILNSSFQPEFEDAVKQSYQDLTQGHPNMAVAVRSSATAEDLPEASFAGQQETFLNVRGFDEVLKSIKHVFASLYTDRAIAYRVHQGFDHKSVFLSVGIQKMVRSDLASSGVMFSLDTESGFKDAVFITSSFGLGEMVVQGAVDPDEFYVYKPGLKVKRPAILKKHLGAKLKKMIYSDEGTSYVKTVSIDPDQRKQFSISDLEIQALAEQAVIIEAHYQKPMDIEWAKDGEDGQLYIVQARPETVQSRENPNVIERFELKKEGKLVTQGRSIGQKIGTGQANVIQSLQEMDKIKPSDILVTDMTDPDWEPIMKRVSGIVTNRGGRTCHAAIIARELGIPAVVGCGNATEVIKTGQPLTVSCAQGDIGNVYEGILPYDIQRHCLDKMPEIGFKIMMNVGNPERAFDVQRLPNKGVGLARLEFLISQMIGVHPQACLEFHTLPEEVKTQIKEKMAGYSSPANFYVQKLTEGIATLGAAFYPNPVIIRFSDFKSNEYANLVGGKLYEPHEENPMIGFRGASRYVAKSFQECFAMECQAVKRVRDDMGLKNIQVMVPFVRTLQEAQGVIEVMEKQGLVRGKNDLKVIMMCELPTNALLADQFLEYFDGFSIGSNDMTQLTLGLDRDSGLVAQSFDERDPAVKKLLKMAINACQAKGKYIGICGQGPSDHPDLARWLMEEGIDSVSLNPDTVVETWLFLAKQEVT